MAWFAPIKKQLIRWYYGEFVYQPGAEIIQFGVVRSRGAQRVSRILRMVGLGR